MPKRGFTATGAAAGAAAKKAKIANADTLLSWAIGCRPKLETRSYPRLRRWVFSRTP
jgi:hypothetical protein